MRPPARPAAATARADCACEVLAGGRAATRGRAAEVDVVMAAIVGAAGLPSTLAAVQAGKNCCWPTRNRW